MHGIYYYNTTESWNLLIQLSQLMHWAIVKVDLAQLHFVSFSGFHSSFISSPLCSCNWCWELYPCIVCLLWYRITLFCMHIVKVPISHIWNRTWILTRVYNLWQILKRYNTLMDIARAWISPLSGTLYAYKMNFASLPAGFKLYRFEQLYVALVSL